MCLVQEESMVGELTAPTIILLKESSIKLPCKFKCLYPYFPVARRPRHRNVFMQWMVINAETTGQSAENTCQ